jgi:hypothetical protein
MPCLVHHRIDWLPDLNSKMKYQWSSVQEEIIGVIDEWPNPVALRPRHAEKGY